MKGQVWEIFLWLRMSVTKKQNVLEMEVLQGSSTENDEDAYP